MWKASLTSVKIGVESNAQCLDDRHRNSLPPHFEHSKDTLSWIKLRHHLVIWTTFTAICAYTINNPGSRSIAIWQRARLVNLRSKMRSHGFNGSTRVLPASKDHYRLPHRSFRPGKGWSMKSIWVFEASAFKHKKTCSIDWLRMALSATSGLGECLVKSDFSSPHAEGRHGRWRGECMYMVYATREGFSYSRNFAK